MHPQVNLQPLIVQKFPFLRYQVRLRANLREILLRQTARNFLVRILAIFISYKNKSPGFDKRPHRSGT